MIKPEYKYSETTAKIIACAMEVHKTLGPGFQEVIYQRALAIELELANFHYYREYEMNIYYKRQMMEQDALTSLWKILSLLN